MLIYHILVQHEYEAQDLVKKIKSFDDFKSIAEKYSKCSSAKQGGLLGPFKRGRFVESFEDACEALNVHQMSQPVRTQFGWHLIYKIKN